MERLMHICKRPLGLYPTHSSSHSFHPKTHLNTGNLSFINHVTRLAFNCCSRTFSDLQCHPPRKPPHFIGSFSTQMLETHVHKIIILLTIRCLGLKIHVHLTTTIVKCWTKLFGHLPTLHTKLDTNIPKFVRGKYKYHSMQGVRLGLNANPLSFRLLMSFSKFMSSQSSNLLHCDDTPTKQILR